MAVALAYGYHAVSAVFARAPHSLTELWVQASRDDHKVQPLLAMAERLRVPIHRVPRKVLDTLVGGARHQGIIVRCAPGAQSARTTLEAVLAACSESPLVLVLDGVQDPHNLGACLRTADASGVHAVVAPKHRAASLTPAARKVACGAAETVPFLSVTNLSRTLTWLREAGLLVVGAVPEAGQVVYETDLTGPLAMVIGGEERGLRRLTREYCDCLVRIPMVGKVASLNVSVAAGVLLYEARRQRLGRPMPR